MTVRAYLRLSPATFHDKVVVDGYPAPAFAAFLAVLCLAEEQPERGRFRSERLLRLLLDEPKDGVRLGWGKHIRYLIDHGDLVRLDDGSLLVVGWDEWQEGDVTVAERMKRLRERRANAGWRNAKPDPVTPQVTPTVTVPVTPAVTPPTVTVPSSVGISGSGGISGGGSVGPSRPTPDGSKTRSDDEELLARYLAQWSSATDPDRRDMLATQLRLMGVKDPAAELARGAA